MYVCMYESMYVCMYVCRYVCMYLSVCEFVSEVYVWPTLPNSWSTNLKFGLWCPSNCVNINNCMLLW